MKSKSDLRPPRLANWLFEWYCQNAIIEDLHGDLEELFYADLKHLTVRKAKIKYWQRVISLIFFLRDKKPKAPISISFSFIPP